MKITPSYRKRLVLSKTKQLILATSQVRGEYLNSSGRRPVKLKGNTGLMRRRNKIANLADELFLLLVP